MGNFPLATVLSLLLASVRAKAPVVHETSFDHLPRKFQYFEDSSTILYLDERSGTVHRTDDDGATWSEAAGVPDKAAQSLIFHPFDKKTAFILGPEKKHYQSRDLGKSWREFTTDAPPSMLQMPLAFNAKNHDLILYAGEHCDDKGGFWGTRCYDHSYYTTDAFDSEPELLRKNTHSCVFAGSTENFRPASDTLVICIDEDKQSSQKFPLNLRLVSSNDWFQTEKEIFGEQGPIRGAVGLGAVQTFIVAATKNPGTDEMSLYVTDDGLTWDLAEFPQDHGGLKEDAYTILESRPYGIQVDVMSSEILYNSFGALFTSNSNGTYFTKNLEHTNRNEMGIVDFENVENLEGIVMANIVANHAEVQKTRNTQKQVQSRISFTDGRSWQPLKAPDNSDCDPKDTSTCSLHLYSAASPHNVGRIFSSTTPGLLMGVGNVGDRLLPYSDCDLFISEDAGTTWRMSKKDAHKYEWGDQGSVLVAIYDEDTTDKLYYSFDRGVEWKSIDLGMKVRARILTTVPDSTTEKFTLVASRGKGSDDSAQVTVFSIDFTGMRPNKCKLNKSDPTKGDFEKFYARYDEDGNPGCLMGHKQFFWRRKSDSNCYVGETFHDPEPVEEDCPCQREDFECDYNFILEADKCVPARKDIFSPSLCKSGEKTFRGPSGYRLIPGNTCDRERGLSLDKEIDRNCEEDSSPPANGKITSSSTDFDGHARQYFYLERSESASGSDETVIMQIDSENVYKTHDQGVSWTKILKGEDIVAIMPHRYFSDWIYFLTASNAAFVSKDRGKTIKEIELPSPPNNMGKPILDFHSSRSSWLLFTGTKGCEKSSGQNCRAVTFYTENGGSTWEVLHDQVDNCQYIGATKVESDSNLIYCTAWSSVDGTGGQLELLSSIDYFETHEKIFDSVVGFAVFEEYIIVAEVFEDAYLRFHASIDGKIFAHGHFPAKFSVDQQQAYTVLDSVTKSIFLHVTTNAGPGKEWGSILKSNSNGTYFVTSIDLVNRNTAGYVDFEKIMGLEGLAIVNVVTNQEDVLAGSQKKLRTEMTHNDGGEWSLLRAPAKDADGKSYDCPGGKDRCSLNLHGYTERVDVRDTYSSGSALGILLGVGNVGEHLVDYEASSTFMSNDGGITWKESHKGPYQWEFGDQGSIVVIVKDGEPTDRVLYTLNEGKSWEEHVFAGEKMIIRDITTVPSDSSRRFLLFAKPDSPGDKMKTISLDFSGLTDRQCVLQEGKGDHDDFYLWTPSHPANEDKCLFGHVTEYHRKKPDELCYIGPKLDALHQVLRNCTCSIFDFECDYNYQRANDGTCQLIPGLDPPDHSAVCASSDVVSWTEPTGYRKIPLTTCEGGKAFDQGIEHACKGHEREYKKSRKGLHGFWLFVVVCIPFALAGAVGNYVWNMNGGRTLGQIRLGDDSFDQNISSGRDKLQEYAVLALSGLVTVVVAVPTIARFLWKAASARFGNMRSQPAYYSTLDNEPLLSDDEDDALDQDI